MSRYTQIFIAAAEAIEAAKSYPGQALPGVWTMGNGHRDWPTLIAIIAGDAMARVAREAGLAFDPVIERFMTVTRGIDFEMTGDPARIAAARLREAARLNTIATETALDRLARLAADAAALLETLSAAAAGDQSPWRAQARGVAMEIRAALGDRAAAQDGALAG